jgi:hypothetical protein
MTEIVLGSIEPFVLRPMTFTFTIVPPPTVEEIVRDATAEVRRLRAMGNPKAAWKVKQRADRILASRSRTFSSPSSNSHI